MLQTQTPTSAPPYPMERRLPACIMGRGLPVRNRGWARRPALLFSALLLVLLLPLIACKKKEPPVSANEVKALVRTTLPSTLEDKIWTEAPLHQATMILQDMVEPRLLTPSTAQVKVQSITDGRKVAFRMQWDDATLDDLPGPARFTDACAVQLPAKVEADVPAPQMGEAGRLVEITYWSASWQAMVNGHADRIESYFPHAKVDHYPFESPSLKPGSPEQVAMAKRYAPARALENNLAGPRQQPVQDLIAEGPGSLRPAQRSLSNGIGKRTEKGWDVLIVRTLPSSAQPVTRSQVAFAVWEGSKLEVGSRKMRTAWIPFAIQEGGK